MDTRFLKRCTAALTHPATLGAISVLLLNDVVFKSLWPDSWVTGKLSDLAWVVFASPLLAFLLSLAAPESRLIARAVIVVAYGGLPLLYAAFNTFAAVHDRMLGMFSLASKGSPGSPLDATDSLMIPLGLGIAIWVWRRSNIHSDSLRPRLRLVIAGVAALATVATSYPEPEIAVRAVGIAPDGRIVVDFRFESDDGGLTWQYSSLNSVAGIKRGGEVAVTPRGTYTIRGSEVMLLTNEGEEKVAYSTSYLQDGANVWVQEQATDALDVRTIATAPYGMIYDERSRNLVVALGIQGVVVGTADGQWSRVAVGRYSPTDFSALGKVSLLLSNSGFWATAAALSLSITAITLVLAESRRRDVLIGGGIVVATLAALVGIAGVLIMTEKDAVLDALLLGAVASVPLLLIVAIGGAILLALLPKGSNARKRLGLALCVPSALASGSLLLMFGGSDDEAFSMVGVVQFVFGLMACVFAGMIVMISWRQLRYWPAVVSALAGMHILIALAFLLWLQLGVTLAFAKFAAVVLASLVAFALAGYLKQREQALQTAVEPPSQQGDVSS